MNRIEERLTALKEEGKKAFITYTTAGLPDYDTTKKINPLCSQSLNKAPSINSGGTIDNSAANVTTTGV